MTGFGDTTTTRKRPGDDPRALVWVGVFFLCAALVCAGLGYKARQKYAHVTGSWTTAPGTIVEHASRSQKPVFSFVTATGETIETTSTFNNGKRALPPGAGVTVYYNPLNPSEAALQGDGGKTTVWILLTVILVGLGGVGITQGRRQLAAQA